MKEDIKCEDVDKVKPLDRLLDDQIKEFESGKDKQCDKDLDTMMWELGDYENEEPKMAATEFEEEKPIEEQLVEKRMILGSNGKPRFVEGASEQEETGEEVTVAHSIGSGTRQRGAKAFRDNSSRKKKK